MTFLFTDFVSGRVWAFGRGPQEFPVSTQFELNSVDPQRRSTANKIEAALHESLASDDYRSWLVGIDCDLVFVLLCKPEPDGRKSSIPRNRIRGDWVELYGWSIFPDSDVRWLDGSDEAAAEMAAQVLPTVIALIEKAQEKWPPRSVDVAALPTAVESPELPAGGEWIVEVHIPLLPSDSVEDGQSPLAWILDVDAYVESIDPATGVREYDSGEESGKFYVWYLTGRDTDRLVQVARDLAVLPAVPRGAFARVIDSASEWEDARSVALTPVED